MEIPFAARMGNMKKSFVRELLKKAQDPTFISLAGGLPNPATFPVEAVQRATETVLAENGRRALQYGISSGFAPLRAWIAERYQQKYGMTVSADDILITNGSQQALDLIGKILIDIGDRVLVEAPSYMGGIHVLRMFEPEFVTVPLLADGVETAVLDTLAPTVKLFYALPNFQNPTGISYSAERRRETAVILKKHGTLFIEDDPYNELRFVAEDPAPIASYLPDQSFLMGSFSKIISPGMRMGWVCAPPPLMEKLIIAKQAADLHSNELSQHIIHQFLISNDLDAHLASIRRLYQHQRDAMIAAIERYLPPELHHTTPQGGMFLWITLPEHVDALALFDEAVKEKVIFVPGQPFFVDEQGGRNALRLSFSNTPVDQIEEGIRRFGRAVERCLAPI